MSAKSDRTQSGYKGLFFHLRSAPAVALARARFPAHQIDHLARTEPDSQWALAVDCRGAKLYVGYATADEFLTKLPTPALEILMPELPVDSCNKREVAARDRGTK